MDVIVSVSLYSSDVELSFLRNAICSLEYKSIERITVSVRGELREKQSEAHSTLVVSRPCQGTIGCCERSSQRRGEDTIKGRTEIT